MSSHVLDQPSLGKIVQIRERLLAILRVADARGLWIVSDEAT